MQKEQVYTDEWARFGPWIDPVETPEDVPRLFRDHPLDLDAARLVLKVPRDIAHRDAKPGMDLYDHLVVVNDDAVTVLTRRGAEGGHADITHGYSEDRIALDDLVAIHDSVNLLHGRVALHARDGQVISMRHSGSPRGGVGRLVEELRPEFQAREPGMWGASVLEATRGREVDLAAVEQGIASELQELRAVHREVKAWACHGRRRLWPDASGLDGAVVRMRHVLSPVRLSGGILAGDDRVLELLGRHAWLIQGTTPTLSSSRLTMPLAAVDGVESAPHPLYPDAVNLTIVAGRCRLPLVVPRDASMVGLIS
ncbi:hypothetical protein [Demequina salsinemoris]|uniref:hypothetical protein n=1 Tax=Demequina salsinemoris TaxID=577470 RepID=UPI000784C7D5|nr:hypothetical protein [Demequina salsinemoris]